MLKSVFLLVFAASVATSSTGAYFSDMKTVSGNVFSIKHWHKHRVVINEVFCRKKHEEWVELYNDSDEWVDIKGWTICNESRKCGKLNPSKKTEIKPHGYVLVSHDASAMKGWIVEQHTPEIYYAGGKIDFNENGDSVVLNDEEDNEVDKMSYGTSSYAYPLPTPLLQSGTLETLERDPAGKDTNTASDFVVRDIPTPGI
jgi:predicted ribosomally synthesized peptide with SipW-like signal peptide